MSQQDVDKAKLEALAKLMRELLTRLNQGGVDFDAYTDVADQQAYLVIYTGARGDSRFAVRVALPTRKREVY